MSSLSRFGVSIASDILEQFDEAIARQNYLTRSKAIEDLMRQSVAQDRLSHDTAAVIGSIDIVYDHHRRELLDKLTNIQHDFQDVILSSQHIHLDHHNCFEIVIVKGQKGKVEELSSLIKAAKGVRHSSLRIATTREDA